MSASDREPLSPEERALAAHLQRLGGRDGPSAAVDARILDAARVAAASPAPARVRRRSRLASWLPAGAITAFGTAAALVLVIGTAWQLRPIERPAARLPTTDDDGAIAVELLGPRAKTAASGAPADEPTASGNPRTSARPTASADSADGAMADHRRAAPRPGVPSARDGASIASEAAPPAAAPPPAVAPDADRAPESASSAAVPQSSDDSQAPPHPTTRSDAHPHPRRATYTTAARAKAESDDRRRTAARPADADTRPAVDLRARPVHEDASLPPVEWLERIRARRDSGDLEAARDSLQRFTRAHPRLRLPPDLRELAR